MCSNKSDIQDSSNENNHSNKAKVIATDIKHITTIFYIVCRGESGFKICMASLLLP